jgi:hypothetical protein
MRGARWHHKRRGRSSPASVHLVLQDIRRGQQELRLGDLGPILPNQVRTRTPTPPQSIWTECWESTRMQFRTPRLSGSFYRRSSVSTYLTSLFTAALGTSRETHPKRRDLSNAFSDRSRRRPGTQPNRRPTPALESEGPTDHQGPGRIQVTVPVNVTSCSKPRTNRLSRTHNMRICAEMVRAFGDL